MFVLSTVGGLLFLHCSCGIFSPGGNFFCLGNFGMIFSIGLSLFDFFGMVRFFPPPVRLLFYGRTLIFGKIFFSLFSGEGEGKSFK